MVKKCCWKNCSMEFEAILTSFDDGKEKIVICPNHAAEYVFRISENENPETIPFPTELTHPPGPCDACEEDHETVLYRTNNYDNKPLEINLCRSHLHRLFARSLEPDAFKALYKKFGDFHEIHDDFYDPEDGCAFQPMGIDVEHTL